MRPIQGDPDAALAAERRRRQVALAAGGGVVLVAVAAAGLALGMRNAARRAVAAAESHLTIGRDGPELERVERGASPEIWFTVVLDRAPTGSRLTLECDWLAPDGTTARHNRWETRRIDRPAWPTHCRQGFDAGSPAGGWTVRMTLDGRELAARRFDVR